MAFLAAHIVLASSIGITARTVQARGLDFFLVTGVNYLAGLAAAIVWTALSGGWQFDAPTVGFGVLQGAHYAISMFGAFLMFQRVGLGVTFTLIYMAVIVPTAASSVLFGERLGAPALAGAILLLVSIPFVARRSERQRSSVGLEWWYWLLVAGLMAITGAGLTGAKAFDELSAFGHRPTYVTVAFATAVPIAFISFMARHRFQPGLRRLRDVVAGRHGSPIRELSPLIAIGVWFGVANASQLTFFILALRDVPGTVAFPVATASVILLTTLAGYVFWRERHRLLTIAGGLLALAGLVLVNL